MKTRLHAAYDVLLQERMPQAIEPQPSPPYDPAALVACPIARLDKV